MRVHTCAMAPDGLSFSLPRSLSLLKKENQPRKQETVFCAQATYFFLYHPLLLFCFIYLTPEVCAVCAVIMELVYGTELRKINGKNP